MPGIVLDRDGTLIADRGDLGDPAEIELLPGVVETRHAVQARFAPFIVTNQSAVAAGRLSREQVERVNAALLARLHAAGVAIERVVVCADARRVFEIKRRPAFDPLVVHRDSPSRIAWLAREVPPAAKRLMRAFWPGPLTLVLPKASLVSDLVTAGHPTVAVRMPAHALALALLRTCGPPVCAPSANPFGYVSPTHAEHVVEQLGDAVHGVIDGGPWVVGIESTSVDLSEGVARVLRPGAIPAEELAATLGEEVLPPTPEHAPVAPGMLPRHYAPRVRLRLIEGCMPTPPCAAAGLLLQGPRAVAAGYLRTGRGAERGRGSCRGRAQPVFDPAAARQEGPGHHRRRARPRSEASAERSTSACGGRAFATRPRGEAILKAPISASRSTRRPGWGRRGGRVRGARARSTCPRRRAAARADRRR